MIFEDNTAHLPDLIRLRLPTFGLEIQDFFDTFFREDVVTATNALIKAQTSEQMTEAIKGDIGICCAA